MRSAVWGERWNSKAESQADIAQCLEQVRRQAVQPEHRLPPVTLEEFDEAAAAMRRTTGLGADQWSPDALLALPPEGRQQLVDIFNLAEEIGVCPLRKANGR